MHDLNQRAYFMAARIPKEQLATIVFGSEAPKMEIDECRCYLARVMPFPISKGGSKIISLLLGNYCVHPTGPFSNQLHTYHSKLDFGLLDT